MVWDGETVRASRTAVARVSEQTTTLFTVARRVWARDDDDRDVNRVKRFLSLALYSNTIRVQFIPRTQGVDGGRGYVTIRGENPSCTRVPGRRPVINMLFEQNGRRFKTVRQSWVPRGGQLCRTWLRLVTAITRCHARRVGDGKTVLGPSRRSDRQTVLNASRRILSDFRLVQS